jgi:hypothetical protein
MSKEVKDRLKKAASSSSEFAECGHICFQENKEKSIPYLDIIYDISTLDILAIEIADGKKKKLFQPFKSPTRHLKLEQKSKKKV